MDTNTTRRTLLKAAPIAAIAAAIPATALAADNSDAALAQAWARWQEARRAYNGLPDPGRADVDGDAIEAEENRMWAIMDEAEEAIRSTTATTQRGATIQLWIALAHSIDTKGQDEAISRADLRPILASESGLDWPVRLIVAALRSLEAMGA